MDTFSEKKIKTFRISKKACAVMPDHLAVIFKHKVHKTNCGTV